MVDRDDECNLVNVRRENMTLFTEVRGTANNIIAAVFNIGYPTDVTAFGCKTVITVRPLRCRIDFVCKTYLHEVADRNGIGTTDTANAEVAFDSALRIRTIVHANDVTATRGFDD